MTQVYTNSDTFTGGAWANSKTVGGMVLISTQTVTSVANLDFTNLVSTYSCYYMVITQCGPATSGSNLRFLVSQDNGATWLTSGYQNGIDSYSYNSATGSNTAGTTFLPLSSAMSANTYVGSFYIYNIGLGSGICLGGQGIWSNGAPPVTGFYLGQGPTGVNALRLIYSAGNIAQATVSLYGVAA